MRPPRREHLVRWLSAAAICVLSAAPIHAQSHAAIGIGVSATTLVTRDRNASNPVEIGPLLRLRTGPGLGPAIGFEWTRMDLDTTVDGQRLPLGDLRVRPFMGGLGYTLGDGPWQLSLTLVAGYSFNRLRVNDMTRRAYVDSIGGSFASIRPTNSLAVRPRVGVWYDVSRRVGLTAGFGYLGIWPELRYASDRGVEYVPVRASSFIFTVGAAYGIF